MYDIGFWFWGVVERVVVFRLPVPLPPDHFAKLIGTTGEGDGHTLIRENSSGEGFRHFFFVIARYVGEV